MAIQCLITGAYPPSAVADIIAAGVETQFRAESLSITERHGERSTCDITLINTPSVSISAPTIGQPIIVLDDSTSPPVLLFAGTIEAPTTKRISAAVNYTEYTLNCVDWHQIADRRNAGEYSWTNAYLNDIALDIFTNSLGSEGITASGITAGGGPLIAAFSFSYISVTDALNALCELASTGGAIYRWKIDYWKALTLFDTASGAADWSLTDSTLTFRNLEVSYDRTDYANWVLVRVGEFLTAPQYESFDSGHATQQTDGSRQSWTMAYPVASVPTIQVNGSAQTVGINGVDTGFDWYWSVGSPDIRQDTGAAALTGSDTLAVTYIGLSVGIAEAVDYTAAGDRAAVEGGTGYYYAVVEANGQYTQADANALAQAILDSSKDISRVARFETDDLAIAVGDRVSINVTGFGSSVTYFVRQVNSRDYYPRGVCSIRRRVECGYGPLVRKAEALRSGGTGYSGTLNGGGVIADTQIRGLNIKDTAVGTVVAEYGVAQAGGTAVRIDGVLRTAITSDLVVDVSADGNLIGTITIPDTTGVGVRVTTSDFTNANIADGAVIQWDITASDGSTDDNGVAQITLVWR